MIDEVRCLIHRGIELQALISIAPLFVAVGNWDTRDDFVGDELA
jgi:hypothetical protein